MSVRRQRRRGGAAAVRVRRWLWPSSPLTQRGPPRRRAAEVQPYTPRKETEVQSYSDPHEEEEQYAKPEQDRPYAYESEVKQWGPSQLCRVRPLMAIGLILAVGPSLAKEIMKPATRGYVMMKKGLERTLCRWTRLRSTLSLAIGPASMACKPRNSWTCS